VRDVRKTGAKLGTGIILYFLLLYLFILLSPFVVYYPWLAWVFLIVLLLVYLATILKLLK